MKVRTNRKRVLAKLAHNKQITWYITPILVKAEMVRKTNERIRSMINTLFPELA
jgi:hypothetical protein